MNTRSVDDHDSPWKEALEQRFPEFLALLFPDVYAQVDWSQGREFLDRSVGRMRRGTRRYPALGLCYVGLCRITSSFLDSSGLRCWFM